MRTARTQASLPCTNPHANSKLRILAPCPGATPGSTRKLTRDTTSQPLCPRAALVHPAAGCCFFKQQLQPSPAWLSPVLRVSHFLSRPVQLSDLPTWESLCASSPAKSSSQQRNSHSASSRHSGPTDQPHPLAHPREGVEEGLRHHRPERGW